MVRHPAGSDALPHLAHAPGVQWQPLIDVTAAVAGSLVVAERRTPGAGGTPLGTHAHAREDARSPHTRSVGASGQHGYDPVEFSPFVVRGTEPHLGRGEHTSRLDVPEQ